MIAFVDEQNEMIHRANWPQPVAQAREPWVAGGEVSRWATPRSRVPWGAWGIQVIGEWQQVHQLLHGVEGPQAPDGDALRCGGGAPQ